MIRIFKKVKEETPDWVRNHEAKYGRNEIRTEVYASVDLRVQI